MIHPDVELRMVDPEIGYGVVATRTIPMGTITWVRDEFDQVIPAARVPDLPPLLRRAVDTYAYPDGSGDWILCWDHTRFVNHSCSPSSITTGFMFELAVRDIAPGEEITNDYATLNEVRPFTCLCGLPECRGEVGPADFLARADQFDAVVAAAFLRIRSVPQPLWDLVRERDEVLAALDGRRPLPSCRAHHHDPRSAGSRDGRDEAVTG